MSPKLDDLPMRASAIEALAWETVQSSTIRRIAHSDGTLYVHFRSDRIYAYPGVGGDMLNVLLEADSDRVGSVGKSFITHIRDSYDYAIVIRDEKENEMPEITALQMAELAEANPEKFGAFVKKGSTKISEFTVPAGTRFKTPEGLHAEDEECRVAFDAQGGVYPIRESIFKETYERA